MHSVVIFTNETLNRLSCTSIDFTQIAFHHLRHNLDLLSPGVKDAPVFTSKRTCAMNENMSPLWHTRVSQKAYKK